MKLVLRENSLSTSALNWYTSSPYFTLSTSSLTSDEQTDTVSFDFTFDAVPSVDIAAAEIVTDIDIIQAQSVYTLNACYQIKQPLTNDKFPVNIFLRQRAYPYKKLSDVVTVQISTDELCQTLSMQTQDSVLLMDLRDYASVVFDIAPPQSSSDIFNLNGGVEIMFSSVRLNRQQRPAQQPGTPQKITNKIVQTVHTVEGWEDKLSAANAGFGIVIAIILVIILAGCVLFAINYSRLQKQREKIRNLNQEMKDLEKIISEPITTVGGLLNGRPSKAATPAEALAMMGGEHTSPDQIALQQIRTGLEEIPSVTQFNNAMAPTPIDGTGHKSNGGVAAGYKSGKKERAEVLNEMKDSPMVIDNSQASPGDNKEQDFEYDYHSAGKGPGGAPAIETSIQSYSQKISRHLGSASKQRIRHDDHHSDDSSLGEKDDIVTNGYGGQGTNRFNDHHTDFNEGTLHQH